jgi:hypothetical protein
MDVAIEQYLPSHGEGRYSIRVTFYCCGRYDATRVRERLACRYGN